VLDVGRMAVVQDPGGAVLALWEPRRHVGAAVVGEPDTMCWNELVTPRPELARAFYSGLFGWTPAEGRTSAHTTFFGDGRPRAGMLAMEPSQGRGPSHWLVYFGVHDCEGQTALAQSLGGRVRARPAECPGADRYTVLDDPEGATFAVITLRGAATDGPG